MDENMTNAAVWLKLHTVLVNLCSAGRITEDQHSAWENALDHGPEDEEESHR